MLLNISNTNGKHIRENTAMPFAMLSLDSDWFNSGNIARIIIGAIPIDVNSIMALPIIVYDKRHQNG